MNDTPKMTRKYKYAKVRYEIELENISHVHNEERKKYRNIQLTLTISIISIFMSIGLLMGTTFAWFSSTVSNSGNVIESGYIDVELLAEHEDAVIDLTNSNSPAFNIESLSPDNNEIETVFTVKNVGNLPFKCCMYFKDIEDEDDLSSKILVSAKGEGEEYNVPAIMSSLIDENHNIFKIDNLEVSSSKQITVKLSLDEGAPMGKYSSFKICLFAKQIGQD